MTDKKPASAIGAGVIGAAIGAAAGMAVTKIMSDPEMKTKATDALQKAKQYALDNMQQVKNKAQEVQETGEDMASEAKRMGKPARGVKSI